MSDYCLMPNEQFFSNIMASTCYIRRDFDDLLLDSASLLKQKSAVGHVAPFGHIILIQSQPVALFFLLNAACIAEKQQIPIA